MGRSVVALSWPFVIGCQTSRRCSVSNTRIIYSSACYSKYREHKFHPLVLGHNSNGYALYDGKTLAPYIISNTILSFYCLKTHSISRPDFYQTNITAPEYLQFFFSPFSNLLLNIYEGVGISKTIQNGGYKVYNFFFFFWFKESSQSF